MRKHFPDVLRSPNVEWLERLCYRPVEPVHELLVELLASTPELHQAKLRERGLHDGVLALLTSPCERARTYAIAYARAHAADMLEIDGTLEGSKRSILKSFGREDVPASWLIDMIYGGETQRAFALKLRHF